MASADGKRTNEAKKVALGKQVIEGIETDGLSVTITIPAGEIGNKLPIEVTTETWYSPELQMVVLSKHHDPRSGDTHYHLTGRALKSQPTTQSRRVQSFARSWHQRKIDKIVFPGMSRRRAISLVIT